YKTFKKPLEIISLIGNAALFNGKPMIHAHVSLSDDKMKVFGGHLKEATVSATCEVVLRAFDEKVARKEDLKIGLKLLDI
ncbi:DNA-binding protein, partial [Candidatus Woesearchaeota archaeon]|nr:DNA-binding protein [Candidatus Woesearchaeota archaeon]